MGNPLGLVEMTNKEYHAAPGTSSTRIKALLDSSLLHYWHQFERPDREPEEPSEDMIFGDATHCAVLEPDMYPSRYVKAPAFNRRTNAGRAMSAEFDTECAAKGQTALTPEDYAACLAIRDRIYKHPVVGGLFTGGKSEQSFFAIDPDTGELVKCRPDYLHDNGWAMLDLKTTRSAKPDDFAKDAANLGYDISVPWYLDVLDTLYGETPQNFIWVAVEKKPPYAICVFFAQKEDIERARRVAKAQFQRLVNAKRTNHWPDWADEVLPLHMPRWAAR